MSDRLDQMLMNRPIGEGIACSNACTRNSHAIAWANKSQVCVVAIVTSGNPYSTKKQ